MPRITAKQHARSVAAYRGKITALRAALAKAEAKAKRKKRRKPVAKPAEPAVVGELVLYEARVEEAAAVFAEWAEWPVRATAWQLTVELRQEGQVLAEETVTVPAEWDTEPASRLVRRELRAWYDRQKESLGASPQAGAVRLVLRASPP